jgi:hypothetical protein
MIYFWFLLQALVIGIHSWREGDKPSSADCQWKYIEQPLSHFARGLTTTVKTYQQRICIYDGYWTPNSGLPVFFYTGNVCFLLPFFAFFGHRFVRKALSMNMSTTLVSCGNLLKKKRL